MYKLYSSEVMNDGWHDLVMCSGAARSSYTYSTTSPSLQFLGGCQRRYCRRSRRRLWPRRPPICLQQTALRRIGARCRRLIILLAVQQLHIDAATRRAVSVNGHASLRVGRRVASVDDARQPASAASSLAVRRRRVHRRRHRERL